MSAKEYKKYWRRHRKNINIIIAVLIVSIALIINYTISLYPEPVPTFDVQCNNMCQNLCEVNRASTLASYQLTSESCSCSCSDNSQAIFGLNHFITE